MGTGSAGSSRPRQTDRVAKTRAIGPYRLDPFVRARLIESYEVNPHDRAAAEWAALPERTLNSWWEKARRYANRVDVEADQPADLGARRLYARARELWPAPAAMVVLGELDLFLDRDPDKPYYDLWVECQTAKGVLQRQLLGIIMDGALGRNGHKPDWRAAQALLKTGWRELWAERVEVTGAEGGPVALEQVVAEAEDRAELALAEIRAKRAAAGRE